MNTKEEVKHEIDRIYNQIGRVDVSGWGFSSLHLPLRKEHYNKYLLWQLRKFLYRWYNMEKNGLKFDKQLNRAIEKTKLKIKYVKVN